MYGLGIIDFKQEKLGLAEFYLQKALTVSPRNPVLLNFLGMVLSQVFLISSIRLFKRRKEGYMKPLNILKKLCLYTLITSPLLYLKPKSIMNSEIMKRLENCFAEFKVITLHGFYWVKYITSWGNAAMLLPALQWPMIADQRGIKLGN